MEATSSTSDVVARTAPPAAARPRLGARSWYGISDTMRFVLLVYAASRLLLLAVAAVDVLAIRRPFGQELTNWDGLWYLRVAARGYSHVPLQYQTTLGFLPVYPMAAWALAHVLFLPLTVAGLAVSTIGGLIATWNISLLATRWWGDGVARRAVVAFCFFPGSIVFSMFYGEGLLLALVTWALLALEERRFWRAGIFAGVATGIVPDALPIVAAIALVGVLELRERFTRRRLVEVIGALCCSLAGIVGFAAFLWSWTGTPLASLHAQQRGWGERLNVFALVHQTRRIIYELSLRHFTYHDLNLNLVVGEAGAVFLVVAGYYCVRYRREISPGALVWTAGVAFLMITSQYVPPNPRMLLTVFPLVIVFARRLSGRAFSVYVAVNSVLLVLMSALTYVGIALRP